ncbi:hypothetical protein DJ021_12470 [Phenylobacterium hankyongense]|uniref:Uncharacterized protein n=1 Tax=Phenylobacterium hankyongense TaxID=1813876 RepID=A0A328AZL2_9CAUL|nr:hypothetical protein [Phenylobacterium hankyongense]RAK60560.1 hypothetical protein DJ021_12470 [Phenylobacterium hankyongense]
MKVRKTLVALAGLALLLSAGVASAHDRGRYYEGRYVTTYRPEVRYVRRTIVVRERVWRPVRHRIHPRAVYMSPYYGYGPSYYRYGPSYAYSDIPPWERHHQHERWERERWERPW